MTPATKLAQVFRTIADLAAAGAEESEMDTVAAEVFTILAEANACDSDAYESLVDAVLEANGWVSPGAGALRRHEAARRHVSDLLERLRNEPSALYPVALHDSVDQHDADVNTARPRKTTQKKKRCVPKKAYAYIVTFRRAFFLDLDVAGMRTLAELREACEENYTGKILPPRASADRNGTLIRDIGAVYANLSGQRRASLESELVKLVATYLPLAREQQGTKSA